MIKTNKIKIALLWLLLLFGLLLCGFLYGQKNIVVNLPLYSFDRYSLVVVNKSNGHIGVINYEDDKAELIALSGDTRVDAGYGFGEYRIDKIFNLGELNNSGVALVTDMLKNKYYVPVAMTFVSEEVEITNLQNNWFNKGSWYDRSGSKIFVENNLLFNKIINKRFGNLVAINSSELAFRTVDLKIQNENLSIEIVNNTELNGIAEATASYFERNGLRVVKTSTGTEQANKDYKCRYKIRKEFLDSDTARWIGYFNGCDFAGVSEEGSRSDVSVLLGKQY